MQKLNPMAMPLCGANLIEASAGTGKTYTITALYLRLLLGFSIEGKKQTPLSIEEILVVTFTEAATAEIKDRVRQRLITLRDKLLGKDTKDEVVNQLFELIDDHYNAFYRIDSAVKSLDDAAIFTIHGFCQRMLKQHAFESGMAFNLQFIMDQSELLETAIKDFWRQFVFPLNKQSYAAVTKCFSSPDAILKNLFSLLSRTGIEITPQYSFDDALLIQSQLVEKTKNLKAQVLAEEFIGFIENTPFKKSKPIASSKNLGLLKDYCESDEVIFIGASNRSFEIWGEQAFADKGNYLKDKSPVTHPLAAQFDELSVLKEKAEAALPVSILISAYHYLVDWLLSEKQKHQLINPDDLLKNLSQALESNTSGELANAILAQYPVALIDEFQDTDPIQYGIFANIYLRNSSVSGKNNALIMIGDPKQAIYGFRGADIFTYIDAKHQVPIDSHYTLDTNYRSSKQIVDGVNSIFSLKDDSFIFNKDIPFAKVNAFGKSEEDGLFVDGKGKLGIHFCVLDELDNTIAKGSGDNQLASICAAQISSLLIAGKEKRAVIEQAPLKASDIAVLVRDRNQANLIKVALQKLGVASVFLSRDSVFETTLASHLLTFLSALLAPYNEATFRGVLVGPLFALNYADVHQLTQNTKAWEDTLDTFAALKLLLQQKGVMAVIESLVEQNALPSRWQQKGWDVARLLTDIRHLGELLQQKQLSLNSYHRLLHWLHDQITKFAAEGSQLRLETDQQLVNIVTMHGSKGLEYPVVYMPFAASFRENSEAVYHDENGNLIYDLNPSDDAKAIANKESLAEDLRLLYVALTRAVHYLVVGLYNCKDGRSKKPGISKTPLGHLLFDKDDIDTGHDWYAQLSTFCAGHTGLTASCYSVPEAAEIYTSESSANTECLVKQKEQAVPNQWRLTSFSSLTKVSHGDSEAFDYKQGANDEMHLLDWQTAAITQLQNEFSFPKGANAGSCLHAIMEEIDFNAPNSPVYQQKLALSEVVEKQLLAYQIESEWQSVVENWIQQLLTKPLAPLTVAMSDLNMAQCLIEMEFMLPVNALVTRKLNDILLTQSRDHFTPLTNATISGMLKGFIDLIFCYDGRYYVLDYKSNYLGESGDDYSQDNMESVMSSHHYHLQYLLYTVALHRLLKSRIRNYDIHTHLGGSFYLFMRGMPSGHGVYYKEPSVEQVLALDSLFDKGTFNA
ncbi:exodeoxyribonuclease V subunit beta [Pseudoalteromonas sp.]|uniref:exodeoxyribonuclease V subunit beta n=1 Tax=Pseudoalteromonas sp. TaxID=53249 RepID=UPI0035672DD3